MAQMVFFGVKWLPVSMTISVALSIGLPYFWTVGLKQLPPFLPFIRHSAAYPPQAGLFTIFITIASFLGILTFALRYVIVKNREFAEDKLFQRLNGASFLVGLLLNLCLIYTTLNPLGFQVKGKEKWIHDVLVPNNIGALAICLGCNFYVLVQAYITYQQRRVCRQNVLSHAIFAACVVISTWTAVIPVSQSLKDIMSSLAEDNNHLVRLEYKEYSFYSTICALSEWSFTFFSLLFILSFYKDFKKMNVRLQLKRKHVTSNTVELRRLGQQNEKEMTKI